MINSIFTSTFNQIYLTYFEVSNNSAEVTNTTASSCILLLLLLASLGLTFHNKGTTVHKVLGLLLTSVFVVFLWMLQSQFLFIYIVYILAFISAVLMLFLSVVLMLPISTLTAKNTLTDKKAQYKAYFFAVLINQENVTISMISSVFILSLIGLTFLIKKLNTKKLSKFSNDSLEYSKYCFQILKHLPSSNLFYPIIENHQETHFNTTTKPQHMVTSSLHQQYLRIGHNIWKMLSSLQSKSTESSTVVYFLLTRFIILWTMFQIYAVHAFTANIQLFQRQFRVAFQLLKVNKSLPRGAVKTVLDVFVQSYLFTAVVLSMSSLFLSKQTITTLNIATLNNESLQGLGQIKALLYGDFSLFLLLSTFVLLIALLGAAVMTRSKR